MNYTKVKDINIIEEECRYLVFIHNKTKAKIFFVLNQDEDKSCGISFKTPPKDNTGLTHILEHSVLCGSKKYPVKDPFVSLLKSSLQTFLNAMTFDDRTLYLFSSPNTKDFNNILSVYLDGVFDPLVINKKEIFLQEGWHYEVNKDGEISYNGVVFNEMLGIYSNPYNKLIDLTDKTLFEGSIYSYSSGGKPEEIVDLNYDDFVTYYKKYYHPSNSYIFFYGNINYKEILDYLDTNYLFRYEYKDIDTSINNIPIFKEPKIVKDYYLVPTKEELKNNTYLSYNFAFKANSYKEILALNIIFTLLFEFNSSKAKKTILEECHGENLYIEVGTNLYTVFQILLTNTEIKYQDSFVSLVNKTLDDFINNALPKDDIFSALEYLELNAKEKYTGNTPRGIGFIISKITSLIYEDKYDIEFNYNKYYEELKKDLSYFKNIVKKLVINNNHKAYVSLIPSLDNKLEEVLNNKIADFKKSLTEDKLKKLIEENNNLTLYKKKESSKEELSLLPKLKKEDLDYTFRDINFKVIDDKLTYSNYKTNDLVYTYYLFDIDNLSELDYKYLNLFSKLLFELETDNNTINQIENKLLYLTSFVKTNIYIDIDNKGNYFSYFIVSFSSLYNKLDKANNLVLDVLLNTKFEKNKLLDILLEIKSSIKEDIKSYSASYALMRALSYIDRKYYITELTKGLRFYNFIKDLIDNYDKEYDSIVSNLKRIVNIVFNKNKFKAHINTEDKYFDIAEKEVLKAYNTFNGVDYLNSIDFNKYCKNEAFIISSKVSSVVEAYSYDSDISNSSYVLENIINCDYLWPRVRVLGGAYGSNITIRKKHKFLALVTNSAPNIKMVLDNYDDLYNFVNNFEASDSDMLENIIGVLANERNPNHPRTLGYLDLMYYLRGDTRDSLIKIREDIINTKAKDIKDLTNIFNKSNSVKIVIGNEKDILENKDIFNDILYLD